MYIQPAYLYNQNFILKRGRHSVGLQCTFLILLYRCIIRIQILYSIYTLILYMLYVLHIVYIINSVRKKTEIL